MMWDYAELSMAAKEAGSPAKYTDALVDFGKHTGHKEMLPFIGVALGIGALGCAGIQKLVKYLKDREKKSAETALRAREELIREINDYDAGHHISDESEYENITNAKLNTENE